MSDIVLILTGAISVVTILLLVIILFKKRDNTADSVTDQQRPRGVPLNREDNVGQAPRRARNARARMRIAANRQQQDDYDEDDEEDSLADQIAMPDGKVGAKKRRKLEMKAEKRAQRERELEDREERKQRQTMLEDQRKKEDEKNKQEEAEREEEEKRLREEKEKEELEAYLKLKETFVVEEEGFEEAELDDESHKFQEFIDYIKSQKVMLLEDLAAKFKLKTQDAIDRVQDLLAQEILVGVIDDRGKFIYITKEELEEVATFIRQRGRVSISELVECSNTLINLNPETRTSVAAT